MRLAPFALVLALAAATAHGASVSPRVSHVSGAAEDRRRLQDLAEMPVNLVAMLNSKCDIAAILAEPVKPQ